MYVKLDLLLHVHRSSVFSRAVLGGCTADCTLGSCGCCTCHTLLHSFVLHHPSGKLLLGFSKTSSRTSVDSMNLEHDTNWLDTIQSKGIEASHKAFAYYQKFLDRNILVKNKIEGNVWFYITSQSPSKRVFQIMHTYYF